MTHDNTSAGACPPAEDEQRDSDARRISLALRIAAIGDRAGALSQLLPILERGPAAGYIVLSALAGYAAKRLADPADAGGHALRAHFEDGTRADADDLPPALRFAMRFITATANDDADMARALFVGILGNPREASDAVGILLGIAATVMTASGPAT